MATHFTLNINGDRTMDQMVQAGAYDGAHSFINQQNFPLEQHAPFDVAVELVDLERIAFCEDAIEALAKRQLRRPTCEEAVYFGAQHPDAQRHRPIVWPHEPFQHKDGSRRLLVHFGGIGYRSLDLYLDSAWGAYCLFAGVHQIR